MRKMLLLLAAALCIFAFSAHVLPIAESQTANDHTEWVARSLREIETIRVGMTRADLLRLFREEGGISARTQRQYVYRECPYIKVMIEFEPVGVPQEGTTESMDDRIKSISKPFLEWSVTD